MSVPGTRTAGRQDSLSFGCYCASGSGGYTCSRCFLFICRCFFFGLCVFDEEVKEVEEKDEEGRETEDEGGRGGEGGGGEG